MTITTAIGEFMDGLSVTELRKMISSPRLSTYGQIVKKQSPERLIGAYIWNKRVSTSIYPIMQCLEITLRNALNEAAKSHYNGNSDWMQVAVKNGGNRKFLSELASDPSLTNRYYRKSAGFKKSAGKTAWISNHENLLKNADKALARAGKLVTSDAQVAELMLGFWVGMFEDAYEDYADPKKGHWPHIETAVFSNTQTPCRKTAHAYLIELKQLRNRISHHEPIWKSKQVTSDNDAIRFLNDLVDKALFLIRSMSNDRYLLLKRSGYISQFRAVCTKEVLISCIKGGDDESLDIRKFRRRLLKLFRDPSPLPVKININGEPRIVVDIWPSVKSI